MSMIFWVLEVFLLLLLIHSINAIINPEQITQWTIERYKRILKFYCFECEIKPSPKTAQVIRYGHLVVAILIVLYMVLIVLIALFGR